MRSSKEVQADIDAAYLTLRELKAELSAAKTSEFLREAGVPENTRPIFVNKVGEKVLVTGFDGSYPVASLIKKDGTVSTSVRRILYRCDEYQFVSE